MRSRPFTPVLALTALTLAALPAPAQFVSIPVTNGNFAITNTGGVLSYSTLPTFLSPVGTINITAGAANNTGVRSATPITTNTPVSFFDGTGSYVGSINFNDGRITTFTNGGVSLRGTATITGTVSSLTLGDTINFWNLVAALPTGATFTYTAQSGALLIPANSPSLNSYPTPQFTIPVSGGSFTMTELPGFGNATVTLNSLLTPLGTTSITLDAPNLSSAGPPAAPWPTVDYFTGPARTATLGGIANGTIALNDGRTVNIVNRLIHLQANTQVVTALPPRYAQGTSFLTAPTVIQGTITGGTISIPESTVPLLPSPPMQLPVQPPVPVPPAAAPPAKPQEYAIGFAQSLNLGGEPDVALNRLELDAAPVQPQELPEVEQSALAFSRLHPAVNCYRR